MLQITIIAIGCEGLMLRKNLNKSGHHANVRHWIWVKWKHRAKNRINSQFINH